MTIRKNKLIFSSNKEERKKGYKKLFKQKDYQVKRDLAKDIAEVMEVLGYDVTVEQAMAYLKSSHAVFDRNYHLNPRR
jgi:uncharacterized protein (UPF0128 family)